MTTGLKVEQGTVVLDEVELFYRREGNFGPEVRPLVIIHGGPGLDHSYFLPYLEPIAAVQPVIYFDQRGSGRSSRLNDARGYTLAATLQDLEGLRRYWNFQQFDVLGFSYGGFVAIEYALQYPSSIRRLILADTAPGVYFAEEASALKAPRITPEMQAAREALHARQSAMNADDFFREDFRCQVALNYHKVPPKELTDALVDNIHYGAEAAKMIWEQSLVGWDSRPRLPQINLPTLVIAGDDDIVTPISVSKEMAQLIPGAKLVVLPQAGHLSFVDDQTGFNNAIIEFLAAPD